MTFNQAKVQEILDGHFLNKIEKAVARDVQELDEVDLERVFDDSAECATLDFIEEIQVTDWSAEGEDDEITVSGDMSIRMDIDGWKYGDSDEKCHVGSAMFFMRYGFCFEATKGKKKWKYNHLDLEYTS
ncbi:MAG: hypothetical protein IJQ81_00255 [Oscillibacter sp.]|nr:hypothetical protein [Oscillibacter sp.]